jgi:Methyltransferase domain
LITSGLERLAGSYALSLGFPVTTYVRWHLLGQEGESRMDSTVKQFWYDYINRNVQGSELEQDCRPNFSVRDFCGMAADIAGKLGKGRCLLDIGAGTGLIDIILSPNFDKIVAVEPLENYDHLVRNTEYLPNIVTYKAFGEKIAFDAEVFDRILMNAVAYIWPESIKEIFTNVKDYCAPHCRILIGELNDAEHRDQYLKDLPGLLASKGFSGNRIEEVMEKNQNASWHYYEELEIFFNTLGFQSKRVAPNPLHPLKSIKFDLIAERY